MLVLNVLIKISESGTGCSRKVCRKLIFFTVHAAITATKKSA